MSITVYGASDDLIEIDGDIREEFNHLGTEPALLAFSDGTVLSIAFDPDGSGNWRITPRAVGADGTVAIEQVPDADDRATLDGDVRWVVYGSQMAAKR